MALLGLGRESRAPRSAILAVMADPTPPEMRDWGLVGSAELNRVVVISPHPDDAVLGCSHLMSAHPGVTVITVYAGRPLEYPSPMERWDALCGFVAGDEVHAARRAEDAAALSVLDAHPVWLDFVEHAYLPRSEWVGANDIVDTLTKTICDLKATAVFAPFGLANPDHDFTHEAALMVRDRVDPNTAWFLYEDMGYKHIPGLLAWRITQLFRKGVWPTPAAVPVDVDYARKQQAVDCYQSQMRALEAEWGIREKLSAPAPEQYWRISPPPPGWEGLSNPSNDQRQDDA